MTKRSPEGAEPPLLDATGYRCPTPVLLLEKALRRMRPGERIRIVADDPVAAVDIPHFARKAGAAAAREAPGPDVPPGACVFMVTAGQRN